jgi:hypothetical protein
MLFKETICVFTQIHAEHINTLCVQNKELVVLNIFHSKFVSNFASSPLWISSEKFHKSASASPTTMKP